MQSGLPRFDWPGTARTEQTKRAAGASAAMDMASLNAQKGASDPSPSIARGMGQGRFGTKGGGGRPEFGSGARRLGGSVGRWKGAEASLDVADFAALR